MVLSALRRTTASFFFKEFHELIKVFTYFSWLHFFAWFTAFFCRWPLNVTCRRASSRIARSSGSIASRGLSCVGLRLRDFRGFVSIGHGKLAKLSFILSNSIEILDPSVQRRNLLGR